MTLLISFASVAAGAVRVALVSLVTAVVFFALFVAAAIWAPQDHQKIRLHMIEAVQTGELNAQTTFLHRFPTYLNLYNCLLFNMMLAPQRDGKEHAISNHMVRVDDKVVTPVVPPFPDCQGLWRALPEVGGTGAEFIQYDRYLIGMRVLGRVILSVTSVASLRHIQVAASYSLLGLTLLLALWRLRRATEARERERLAGIAAIALAFGLFYGVYHFDATLNFAAMDCTMYLFVLIGLLCPLHAMQPATLALYGASFGSLIAIFEFLTGGLPVSLALLPLLLGLGFRSGLQDYTGKLIQLWASFCIAAIAMFAFKKLYTVIYLGDTENFMASMLYRTYGAFDDKADARYSLIYLAMNYYSFSTLIAYGVRHLGPLLELAGFAALAAMTWRCRDSLWQSDRTVVWAGWLSLLALAIWFAVFLNHALLHVFYMARMLVVPIFVGTVVVAAALVAARAGRTEHRASA